NCTKIMQVAVFWGRWAVPWKLIRQEEWPEKGKSGRLAAALWKSWIYPKKKIAIIITRVKKNRTQCETSLKMSPP
ncbi:MAG: hypothetical protein WBR10_21445, partial [Candidatus Acidiferrum sp.]